MAAVAAPQEKKPYRVKTNAGKLFHDDRERDEFGDLKTDDKGLFIGKCNYYKGETVLLTDAEAKQYAKHVEPAT